MVTVGHEKCRAITNPRQDFPDIPPVVLTSLHRQYQEALERMDGFYQKALEHMAPKLVLEALNGQEVSWRATFNTEVKKFQGELARLVHQKALGNDAHGLHMVTIIDMQYQGRVMGKLVVNDRGISWTNPGDRNDGNGSPVTLYMVLPDVVKQVQRYVAMVEAVKLADARFNLPDYERGRA
jgi:hypothetical protein